MLTPRSETESAIVELWKEFRPNEAFVLGIDECAGRVFVPTPAKVRQIQARISRIRRKTRDPTERKLLASFRAALELREPAQLPQSLVETMFGYLIKEGTNADHLASFARFGRRALDARRRQVRRVPPPGMRALVQLACSGLADMLKTVEGELRETRAHEAIRALIAANARYAKAFDLPGFPVDGSFQDVYAFFKRSGCDLGRSQSYARALRDFWDYEQTPAQVEAAGLRMIRRELPHFHALVQRFAEELSCGATAEAVTGALKEKRGLRPDQILPFLKEVRDPARRVAHKHVVAINPDYATDVVETPSYLANSTPSGAAFGLDTLTDHPREIFLATTDVRSAARPPPGELLNLLIHEEYGHCVHGSNSALSYAASPRVLDLIASTFQCVSEGIAFQRELEFLPIIQEIAAGKLSGPEEDAFAESLERWGGLGRVSREYEFLTALWRIVRFLRVIGDARINSGKQDLVHFVEWAYRTTGLERATVYYQLFPAHQVIGPGYASTYAIIGERIREIQQEALKRGKSLRAFNGYASSIGWPPKSVFEAELEAWARSP
ncbi:MAG: hypothetical protein E6K06_02245 [Methanobacteriota archaeon]|nr:MAG: hypothetical protein E6K09_06775 [Euryarchaeota archaeon]TLZ73710.1 MAG: hypothetical protein E6K06_02245 [Euryarchaeota archaeon]